MDACDAGRRSRRLRGPAAPALALFPDVARPEVVPLNLVSGSPPLPPGKLAPEALGRLLAGRPPGRGEVVGPGVGLDAAVLDLGAGRGGGGPYLVAASDPITFAPEDAGWYAVHVNANDVACMGAEPAWFLATVLLAEGSCEKDVRGILERIREACAEVGAALVGGHTEVAPGSGRTVVAGTMLGVTDRWISAAGARMGDRLLLTKGAAIEGTAILAATPAVEGKADPRLLARARRLLREPGFSVVRDARIALGAGRVHALHDPTEGGIAGGIHELCVASGTGARVELERIPVLEETRAIADALGLDPLGLIASGALLAAVPARDEDRVLAALVEAGIPAAAIGTLAGADEGVLGVDGRGRSAPLARFERDEITRAL